MSESLKELILNKTGRFGEYGGCYVPEMLMPVMEELAEAFYEVKDDPKFIDELYDLYVNYSGRPTPLYYCKNLSEKLGGAKIYMKNEGLNHTGAHKISHCLGQALLAKRLGKKRIIAETGAGQHGLASATVAAKFGMECTVHMGAKDYARQRPNVFWMERLGAEVIPVETGGKVLKDAISSAMRDLLADPDGSHYLLGTACGPHPYPAMNAFFQSVVGKEVKKQILEFEGKLPDYVVACVGGGSNALGIFHEFLDDEVKLVAVEAGGKGIGKKNGKFTHASRFQGGEVGVVEGFKSYFLQDENGQIMGTHSVSAGMDYSGISPQLAYLKDFGRIETAYALDEDVLGAYKLLAKTEGVLAAMESSHALAEVVRLAPELDREQVIVWNCSGRGDKDLFIVAKYFDQDGFREFLREW